MDDLVREHLKHLLAKAEAGLAALPAFEYNARGPYDAAVEALVRELETAGGRIRNAPAWELARVSIAGITSTSTSGTANALHNWIAAAKKRLAAS